MRWAQVSASVGGLLALATSSLAQFAYQEAGTDLPGFVHYPPFVGEARNTSQLDGTLAATFAASTGDTLGDDADSIRLDIPADWYLSSIEIQLSNGIYSNSALYVETAFGPMRRYTWQADGIYTIPINDGNLAPGTYRFIIGLVHGESDTPGTASAAYTVLFYTQPRGALQACCNERTGHCVVMSSNTCVASGLTVVSSTTCSPTACRPCPADFNGRDGVSIQDLFDFLAAWFAGCP